MGEDNHQPPHQRPSIAVRSGFFLNSINGNTNDAFFAALRAGGVKPADIPTLSFSVGEQELRGLKLSDTVGDYAAWTYFQSVATAPED